MPGAASCRLPAWPDRASWLRELPRAQPLHVRRSNPVPAANRFHMDFLTKNSCYENTVLFAQYSTLIQIKLQ
eukprot:COSAG01_NODE_2030_length_8590_cov_20.238017_13_plen_72_part_00